jgi:hypothetical protein
MESNKNLRPRPRVIDKQRPEAGMDKKKSAGPAPTDKNINLGVPDKLRRGSQEAFQLLARRNAAMGGNS